MNKSISKLYSVLNEIPISRKSKRNIINILDNNNKELKQETDSQILLYHEDEISYGVEKDIRVNSTECVRVGNLNFHRDLPIHNLIKGCLLDDNGNIVEYLPENDWTTATRDGSKGQVMVHIPAHYRKFYTKDNGNIIGVRISLQNIDGYHYVDDMFVSAYEASLDRKQNKLSSVVNTSVDFRGGTNIEEYDNTYKSLLGLPASYFNMINAKIYANNRGNNYYYYLYECHKTLLWLYVIEYSNFNCQLPYTSELTENGYHKGGLGAGVTNIPSSSWKTFNNQNPIIPCGYTDELGNNTGVKDYILYNDDDTIFKTVSVPRYRGIENIFGHTWKMLEGANIRISADIDKGGDGLSKLYICSNLNDLNDNNIDKYEYVGNISRTKDYVHDIVFGETGCFISSVAENANSDYPIGDSSISYLPESGYVLKKFMVGGLSYSFNNAGLFCTFNALNPTTPYNYTTTRLCYRKNKIIN